MNKLFVEKHRVCSFYSAGQVKAVAMLTAVLLFGCAKSNDLAIKNASDIIMLRDIEEVRQEQFELLPMITFENQLPYAMSNDGTIGDFSCFEVLKTNSAISIEGTATEKILDNNKGIIQTIISAWVVKTFEKQAAESLSKGFKADLRQPIIEHISGSEMRLKDEQSCIKESEKGLIIPERIVVTMFGAFEIEILNQEPLDQKTLKKMRDEVKQLGITMKTILPEYPRAKDKDGNPMLDDKGRPLFVAPNGDYLLAHVIPRPKDRPVYQWTLVFEKPFFFGRADLPKNAWLKETSNDPCELYLVFDSPSPQLIKCGRMDGIGFGVSAGPSANEAILKITVDNNTTSKPVSFGKRIPILAQGRVLTWASLTAIEEGAKLKIEKAVILPGESSKQKIANLKKKPEIVPEGKPEEKSDKSKKNPQKGPVKEPVKKNKEEKLKEKKEEKKEDLPPPPIGY